MFLGYQNGKITFYTDKKLNEKLYNLDKVVETQDEYVYDYDLEEFVLNTQEHQDNVYKQTKKVEILKELEELDLKSIRVLRANEAERLEELEARAISLRNELSNL